MSTHAHKELTLLVACRNKPVGPDAGATKGDEPADLKRSIRRVDLCDSGAGHREVSRVLDVGDATHRETRELLEEKRLHHLEVRFERRVSSAAFQ